MSQILKSINVKSIRMILILLILVLLLFPFYFFIRNVVIGFDDPTMRIFYGLYDAIKEDSPQMTLHANATQTPEEYDLIKEMDFEFSSGIKNNIFGINAIASFNGELLKNSKMIIEDQKLYFNDHDEVIFVDGGPYFELLETLFQGHHYFQYIDLKGFYWKKYMNKISEEMADNINVSENQIKVHLDLHDLLNSAMEVLLLAKEDPKLKKDLKKSFSHVLEAMIDDDYTFLKYDQSDWKRALTYMDSEWDVQYEEKIMDLYHFVKDLRYAVLFLSFQEPDIYFQFDGLKLTNIEMDLMINQYRWFLTLNLNEGYYGDSYKDESAESYLDFTDEEKKMYLGRVIDDFKINAMNTPSFLKSFETSGLYKDYQAKYKFKTFDEFINRFKLNMFKKLELQ